MKRYTRLWGALVAMAIFGLVAAACQPGPPGQPPTAADEIDPNGELRLVTSEPDTIDPQKASFTHEIAVIMRVFEPLMTFDPKTFVVVPAAAKEQKISADGLTYTYTLKDGLKYSDGQPVRAKDFEYAFKRLCDPETHGEYAGIGVIVVGCEAYQTADAKKTSPADLQKLRDAVGVKASGDNVVEYKITNKASYFPAIMGLWVGVPTREDMVKKGGEKWTEPETYIGNGYFKLSEWRHNEKIVYERNDNHAPPAKLKRISTSMISEVAVAFAAYRNDEVDIYGVGGEDKKVVEGDPALSKELSKGGDTCVFYYGFHNDKPPFDDPKVRLAFAKGIDRQAWVNDIQQGLGGTMQSFLPPGLPGYDKDDDTQKFDPAAAKKLLGESKYGTNLPAIKYTYSSSARNKTRAEWATGQWKQHLGLDIPLDPVDSTTYTRLVKDRATTPQLYFLGWCADYPDQYNYLFDAVHVSLARTAWKNKDFDKLVNDASQEIDKTKRDQMYKDAQRLLTKDAPVAFLYNSASWALLKPWVKGYERTPLDYSFASFTIQNAYVTKGRK